MMKRKHQLLTESERDQILAIPTQRDHLARLYTFEPSDIEIIGARRERLNQLGVALQLALLRHPGITLAQLIQDMLRKLAAYERQNQLDVALQEIGKIERTLFMLDWLENPDLRRRCHAGLNNSEQRHALTRAIYTFRQGRIIDRSHEAQQYRASGLNLVIAAIVYLQAAKLGLVLVEGGPADPVSTAYLRRRHPSLLLLQNRDDLRFAEPPAAHLRPTPLRRTLQKIGHISGAHVRY